MCGIVGKINLTGQPVAEADLVRMRDSLTHRGPDDAGLYFSPRRHVGLGHRRLSIIDLSSQGHQPMNYRDRYWIVYNGEIYNFQSLRADLIQQGYRFNSQTDTEVILALYDRYGAHCVEYLVGMFAFAVYDTQENILFCARDRVGQKPFKFYYDGRVFLFASELKAILTQPEYKRQIDEVALHHYLTYQFVPAPRTGFVGIEKLEPAHSLTLNITTGQLTKNRYWQLSFSPEKKPTETEWVTNLQQQFDTAVHSQMQADVPLGAFLSGGIDSSAVVASMQAHGTAPVKTFSIGFPDTAYNELPYARLVADALKTEHAEFVVKPEAVDVLPDLIATFEEPYADSSAIPTYYLSKLARRHVTVALNGDGGDENFAGYARYNFHKLASTFDQCGLSHLPLKTATATLAQLIPNTFTMRAARFAESLRDQPLHRYVSYLCYFTNRMKAELYQPAFARRQADENSYAVMANAISQPPAAAVSQALAADIAVYLPDDLLVKVDIASMHNSLEARSPFLDHRFLELAAHLPSHLKLNGFWQNKYILKKMMASRLPAAILNRPKMGFVMPIEAWFRGSMKNYLNAILQAPDTRLSQTLLRTDSIKKLLNQHQQTTTNVAPPLWALLTLELWLRRYF